MARQVIAENWKTIKIDFVSGQFISSEKFFGRYTKQTAIEKITAQNPTYTFRAKPNHGFGGYWVDAAGNTLELVPTF